MAEGTDKIENVGIKGSQKQEIEEVLKRTGKYKSINEFVQTAVMRLLNMGSQEVQPNRKGAHDVLSKISAFCESLLEDEFSGKLKLDDSIASILKSIQLDVQTYRLRWSSSRTDELLIARSLFGDMDKLIEGIDEDIFGLDIPEEYAKRLKSLRNDFVKTITSKEG